MRLLSFLTLIHLGWNDNWPSWLIAELLLNQPSLGDTKYACARCWTGPQDFPVIAQPSRKYAQSHQAIECLSEYLLLHKYFCYERLDLLWDTNLMICRQLVKQKSLVTTENSLELVCIISSSRQDHLTSWHGSITNEANSILETLLYDVTWILNFSIERVPPWPRLGPSFALPKTFCSIL